MPANQENQELCEEKIVLSTCEFLYDVGVLLNNIKLKKIVGEFPSIPNRKKIDLRLNLLWGFLLKYQLDDYYLFPHEIKDIIGYEKSDSNFCRIINDHPCFQRSFLEDKHPGRNPAIYSPVEIKSHLNEKSFIEKFRARAIDSSLAKKSFISTCRNGLNLIKFIIKNKEKGARFLDVFREEVELVLNNLQRHLFLEHKKERSSGKFKKVNLKKIFSYNTFIKCPLNELRDALEKLEEIPPKEIFAEMYKSDFELIT